jgi:hypothetical protein
LRERDLSDGDPVKATTAMPRDHAGRVMRELDAVDPGGLSYVRLLRTATDWEREDQLETQAAS